VWLLALPDAKLAQRELPGSLPLCVVIDLRDCRINQLSIDAMIG
jgi:hypothetical protein